MVAPKLRFQEFDDAWSNSKIDDIAVVTSGGTPSRSNLTFWDGNIPWVTTSLVDFNIIQSAEEFITQKGLDNSSAKLFPKNTILMAMYGQGITRGKVAILGIDATTNQACAAIKLQSNYDTQFIFQNLMSRYEEIRDLSNDGGQKNLSAGIIKEIEVYYPEKTEQIKIASFLSVVDEKISQFNQKHELLSQYKQGMMQKLFSQQIRFKADDGSEFGEWDEYSLDTLLSKIIDNRGKTPVTEANLEIPLIEVNAIGQRRIKYEKVSKYFSEDTFQNWFRAYLEHQDILFSTVGNTAICSIYTDEIKAGIAQNIVGLRANTKLIQPTFLYYLLTEISNNQKFKSIEMQAVQPSIKVSQMIHLTFLTPCLEEQTKIANFLSSIDQKIEVTAQQIEQAKQWKKGLLQQMFV